MFFTLFFFCCRAYVNDVIAAILVYNLVQPPPQGLLGVQNGGSENILANSRSRVSKNIGDFDCFKLPAGFAIG